MIVQVYVYSACISHVYATVGTESPPVSEYIEAFAPAIVTTHEMTM